MTTRSLWPVVKVGDLLSDIQPGFACGVHNSSGSGLPHFRPMNVSTEGRIDRSELKFISPHLADRPERRLRRGDVLFNNTNSPELVGKTALFNGEDQPAFSNHMTRLRTDESRVAPAFLALALHQAWRGGWFSAHCNNHVSQASISRDVLRSLAIPVPPIEIQLRIFALSERMAESRRSSTAHLAAARRAVDNFRQSILAAACSQETLDSGAEWRTLPLGDLVRALDQGWSPQCLNRPRADVEEWGVMKTTAIQALDFKPNENKALPPTLKPRPALSLEPGDLLITRAGPRSRVGISCLVRQCPPRLMLCDKAYRVRVDRSRVLEEYLEFVLNSPDVLDLIESMKTGTSDSGMNLTQKGLLLMPVSIPDLEEQRRIVELTRGLLRQADHVASSIGLANTALNRAVSSMLDAFFRGSSPIATPSRSAFRGESRATQ